MSRARKTYSVLTARLSPKNADLAAGLLYQAGLDTFGETPHRSFVELRIQLPARVRIRSCIVRLRELEKCGLKKKIFLYLKAGKIREGRWASDYQKFLKPFELLSPLPGKSAPLFIDPRGRPKPSKALRRDTLYIMASLAFGTGTHATTQLSSDFLVEALCERPRASVLDVGCGTAILSMVARKSGAKQVYAFDNDPIAVEMAKENVRLNRVSKVTLAETWPESPPRFDIVIANIERNVLLRLKNSLARHLKPKGLLILSGLLYRDVAPVLRAYAGFKVQKRKNKKGWTALWLNKKSDYSESQARKESGPK